MKKIIILLTNLNSGKVVYITRGIHWKCIYAQYISHRDVTKISCSESQRSQGASSRYIVDKKGIPGDVGGYPVEYDGKRVLLAQIQDWRIPTVRFCPVCALGFQDTPKFPAEMREAKENEGEKRNAPPGSRETCHEQKVTLFSI